MSAAGEKQRHTWRSLADHSKVAGTVPWCHTRHFLYPFLYLHTINLHIAFPRAICYSGYIHAQGTSNFVT